MHATAIESMVVVVPNLEAVAEQYARLGIAIGPLQIPVPDLHVRSLVVGHSDPLQVLRFIEPPAHVEPHHPLRWRASQRLAEQGAGAVALILQVPHLRSSVATLAAKGVPATCMLDGPFAWFDLREEAGVAFGLCNDSVLPTVPAAHAFPLKRMDHLAIITHQLEATTRFWHDQLDLPVVGEIVTPTMIIRQIRIGDVMLELLGPTDADSPIWKRPQGLLSMTSWEVPDLEAAVAQARAAGFHPSDPAIGVLPGTRTATIPGTDLGGVNMQLLQYVS
ncbi:VOC family protein [Tuwongella immobilis]|uniref:VOC domain-containing protein n=1 Tax=Tuwongella immobilis TaxID=692036 RepID=A0A6C2YMF8_9BACT|nr:VOC family protein [Tuwongella immobilis]VIP02102.1 Methylmalonyl-CoA epimerase OS=Geobacter lovleyi (strain ATCC BAA-1151 / DSM 17278 / SZ) GN=Glov_3258 PE=4 SV=1: Glyoxalase_4 [Tuwongella immobilis]VTS00392.1 Methylmalonyl-CoA epimerase OS=Geobacter lovleyi (strain ATCC BAA-1151 / DSM 17278 / SZ) GN=Glov_3258 PE=4 SV=1: Glyoxalase_4 [Tuwongella immobilis]